MPGLERFGVSIPAELVKAFDKRIKDKGYKNRSEAFRDLMRDYLVEGEWEDESGIVVGTVTIVYNHGTRELSHALNDIQHKHSQAVICSTHVHLDEHNCLEVVILRATASEVKAIADYLISTRGVKHGKLVCTTVGANLK